MTSIKMNKYDFWGILFASNKRLIVSVMVVFGGLITRESYALLKRPGISRIRLFLARTTITFFLCLILNAYINSLKWSSELQYVVLGTFALSCISILDWFLNSFLPGLLKALKTAGIKWLIGMANDSNKEDKEDKP